MMKKLEKQVDVLYDKFCEFMLKETNEAKVFSAGKIMDRFNEIYASHGYSIEDKKTVQFFLQKMENDNYEIKPVEESRGSSVITRFYCANLWDEYIKNKKEIYFKTIESAIKNEFLTIEDVDAIIKMNLQNLSQKERKEIMSYFGFKEKASFRWDQFLTKVKKKFLYKEISKEEEEEKKQIINVYNVIREARVNNQQIIFKYLKYDSMQKKYNLAMNKYGHIVKFRYNGYDVVKFGNRYYTIGRDITEPYNERVYRVDLMREVKMRKDEQGEDINLCELYRSDSVDLDIWSCEMKLIEFYKGIMRKINLIVKSYASDTVIKDMKKMKKQVALKHVDKITDELTFNVKINEAFLCYLMYHPQVTHVIVDGKSYNVEKHEELKRLKKDYIDSINVLKKHVNK